MVEQAVGLYPPMQQTVKDGLFYRRTGHAHVPSLHLTVLAALLRLFDTSMLLYKEWKLSTTQADHVTPPLMSPLDPTFFAPATMAPLQLTALWTGKFSAVMYLR